ncbi:MAG: hypothetical protein HRT89_22710 [Lentisphaeria bacterium]|nr:hypothetical protein [Lentisphaeria bacterium]NQZ70872.1 hypothetical protein [Lentisphaeria bacterium]
MKYLRALLLCLFVFSPAFAQKKKLAPENRIGDHNPFILMPLDKKVAGFLDQAHKANVELLKKPGKSAAIKTQKAKILKSVKNTIKSIDKKSKKKKTAADKAYKMIEVKLDKAIDADKDIEKLQEEIEAARSIVLGFKAAKYNYTLAEEFIGAKLTAGDSPWAIKTATISGSSVKDESVDIKPDATKLTLVVFYNPRHKESLNVASQVAKMGGKDAEFIGVLINATERDAKKAGFKKKKVILDDRVLREKFFVRFLPQVMVLDGTKVKAVYIGKIKGLKDYIKYYIDQRK